ncbi:condensation domain-containing protein [Chitinophaga sp. OAE865]|uniref:condensation domain-containing protein n=1 Tax=Chitinophaga sp. OAE865 TaxID=2817898 RepID=UPI001AEB6999
MKTIFDATCEQVQCYNYHLGLAEDLQHQILFVNVDTEHLDLIKVREAINIMTKRHDSLRTAFSVIDGKLMQYVVPYEECQVPFYYHDISGRKEVDQFIREVDDDWRVRLKDTRNPPLWCCNVFKTSEQSYSLGFLIHHLVADGWSLSIILKEVNTLYWTLLNGETPGEHSLGMQVKDYALLQKEWLLEKGGKVTAYWDKKLLQYNERAKFPKLFDLLDPSSGSYFPPGRMAPLKTKEEIIAFLNKAEASSYVCDIRLDLHQQVKYLADSSKMGLGAVIIASLQLLFLSEVGRDQILIAMPVSGRYVQGTENMIGYLGGGVYLAGRVDADKSVIDCIRSAQVEFIESVQHIIYDHDLIGHMGHEIRVYTDLYLNYKNKEIIGDRSIGAIREKEHLRLDGTEYYPLSYFAAELVDGIEGRWKHNLNLYTYDTVEKLATRHLAILQLMCEHPGWSINQLVSSANEII